VGSRTFRPLPLRLEERTLLSTVTWINANGGDWDTPSNWSTDALPSPSDDVDHQHARHHGHARRWE
jgi:hypothetical protein